MAIIYDPSKMLKKVAPEAKIKRMLRGNLSLKRTALSFVNGIDFIDKKAIAKIASKTVRGYQERAAKASIAAGFEKSAGDKLESEILDDPKQLIQRVQNEVLFQVSDQISKQYAGMTATWLPSDAEEPDPEHQLNYGKTYVIGVGINGEEPGQRFGCQCGMEIHTKETQLKLE